MAQIKISVVIPCFNAEKFIGEAIESVLSQTYPPYEVIVVDDGSIDNSADVVRSFGDRVKLIQQENKGRVEARKVGFKYATGDWIALLDADDYWHSKKLEIQVKFILDNFSPDMVLLHGKDKWVGNVKSCSDSYVDDRPQVIDFRSLFQRMLIATSSALLRRDILLKVMDYWNLGRLRSQDYGLYLLMLCHGSAFYIDKLLSYYRVHDFNVHDSLPFAIGRFYARKNVLSYIKAKKYYHLLNFDWREIMASNCLEIAWLFYVNKEYSKARQFILKSFRYKMPKMRWLSLFFFLFMPKRIVTSLRKLMGSKSLQSTSNFYRS